MTCAHGVSLMLPRLLVLGALLLLGAILGCGDWQAEQDREAARQCHAVLSYARTSLDTVTVLTTQRYEFCVKYGHREVP